MPTIFSKEELGKNRINGFYETPPETVNYMVSKIVEFWKPGMKILDPAVGNGVFLYALRNRKIPVKDIYGFDIDAAKIKTLRVNFPNLKVFDSTNPFPERYDFIIGNPPYNGDESHFVREHRNRLKGLFVEIGVRNTYSMISYQAIKSLRPNGRFSMIIEDSFLTTFYYKEFREFLINNSILEEILLAPRKLFHAGSADVRTCILTLMKKASIGSAHNDLPSFFQADRHNVRLIDRVASESEYKNPPKVEYVEQKDFNLYPNAVMLIGLSKAIRDIYLNSALRLGDVVEGGTGISTGDDKKFLRKREDVENDPQWVPYWKNGARKAYRYLPGWYIEKNYKKYSSRVSNYMIRNEKFFFKEGITCSSVGVRFSAAYMPPGGLFGVNANFMIKDPADKNMLFYLLGLLNSKLGWFFARRLLVRTNNISANYLRQFPLPQADKIIESKIIFLVKGILAKMENDLDYDFIQEQKRIDELVFKIYKISPEDRTQIMRFCENFYDQI
ncbi:MAG: N-6 DNA methylase [Candidatus Omnitrophica bacterium]|nr:N-6 DNA methylase [Candidatus Omnitrophota bacterium]